VLLLLKHLEAQVTMSAYYVAWLLYHQNVRLHCTHWPVVTMTSVTSTHLIYYYNVGFPCAN